MHRKYFVTLNIIKQCNVHLDFKCNPIGVYGLSFDIIKFNNCLFLLIRQVLVYISRDRMIGKNKRRGAPIFKFKAISFLLFNIGINLVCVRKKLGTSSYKNPCKKWLLFLSTKLVFIRNDLTLFYSLSTTTISYAEFTLSFIPRVLLT